MSWFNADYSIGSRLDRFCISPGLVKLSEKCKISPCCVSDHDFVSLCLDFNALAPRGPGMWKINNAVLGDDVFCAHISARITDLASCKENFDSVKAWWDFFKRSLKDEIIAFSREKRKVLSRERVSLSNRLINLRRQLIQGDSSVSPDIIFLEAQLAAVVHRTAEGAKIRSRIQCLEEGEKPTRFFFKLEKERYKRNQIKSIFRPDVVEVTAYHEIEQAHVAFYSELFSAEEIDGGCRDRLLQEISAFLRALCEGVITLAELTASLKTQNRNKAPGPDGLSPEFYTKFGPLLLEVINHSHADSELPESMKASMTRLKEARRY